MQKRGPECGERGARAYDGGLGANSRIVPVYKVDKMMTLLGRVSAVCDRGGGCDLK